MIVVDLGRELLGQRFVHRFEIGGSGLVGFGDLVELGDCLLALGPFFGGVVFGGFAGTGLLAGTGAEIPFGVALGDALLVHFPDIDLGGDPAVELLAERIADLLDLIADLFLAGRHRLDGALVASSSNPM